MRSSNIICLFFLFGILASSVTNAQYPHPTFINYTSDDGLPSSEVHVTFQDQEGYIWFGTDNGLSRFDGYEFKNYSAAEGLIDPVVFDIMEDDEKRLWVLTLSGQIFINQSDSLIAFQGNEDILKNHELYSRAENFQFSDDYQEIYLSLLSFGVIKFDLSSYKHTRIKPDRISYFILDSADIKLTSSYMPPGHQDSIPNEMLAPISVIKDGYRFFSERTKKFNSSGYASLIGTEANEYVFMSGEEMFFVQNDKIKWREKISSHFTSLCQINNEVWIGLSDYQGLVIVDQFEDIRANKYKNHLLENILVSSIFKDRQKGVWITSIENGVFYCPNINILTYDKKSGLDQDFVKSITIKNNEIIYVANWQGSITELDHKNKKIISKIINPAQEKHNYDLCYFSGQDKLLLGTRAVLFKNNVPTLITSDNSTLFEKTLGLNKISSRIFDSKILFNSITCISELDINTNTLIADIDQAGRNSTRIIDANFDLEGKKWVSRIDGVFVWDNRILTRPHNLDSLLYNRVEAIEFLSDGQIVLGTKGNGIIIGCKQNEILKITTKDGLTANNIENIHIDSLDQIWVGTLNGLNRINIIDNEVKIKVFTKKHGLPSNEITRVRTQPGITWVATNNGLCQINNQSIQEETTTPRIHSIKINGQYYNQDHLKELNHNQKNIRLDYVALDYKALGDIRYRYRLHKEDDWQYTNQKTLNFSNLAANTYNFEVQAQNEDRFWSKSAQLSFKVLAPFWQKIWFYILLSSLLLILAYLYYRNRVKMLSKELETKEQLMDLERSALQAQMNPHFIFNILNSIQSAIIENEKEKATLLLAKFAKLVRTTLNNTRSKTISLSEEISYLESYLHLEKIRFRNKFNYTVTCNPDIDPYSIELPPMLTQPFVENAIQHGMKGNNQGEIKVNYDIHKEQLQVSIFDNGEAIKSDFKKHRDYKALGIKITNQRLAIINNTPENFNNISIDHHQSEDGTDKGKTILLKISI